MSLITRFCGPKDSSELLRQPFRFDGFMYATNGHVAVRMPDDATVDAAQESADNTVIAVFAKTADIPVTWHAIPAFTSDRPCRACGGNKRVYECPDCDGEGEFQHGAYDYQCQRCDGNGVVGTPGVGDTCTVCCGTGINQYDGLDVAHAHYAKRYLRLIEECFPGAEIGVPADEHATAMFRRGDVAGLIIPMRRGS